jgi:hypothetical protein
MESKQLPAFILALEQLNIATPLQNQINELLKQFGAENQASTASFIAIGPQIHQCFSLNTIDEIESALVQLELQTPSEWIADALKRMSKNSPLAMAGTLRMIQFGKSLNLSQCFAMELALASHWMKIGDFVEGIRALIIDKDNAPKWRFDRAQLSPAQLNALLPELYPH